MARRGRRAAGRGGVHRGGEGRSPTLARPGALASAIAMAAAAPGRRDPAAAASAGAAPRGDEAWRSRRAAAGADAARSAASRARGEDPTLGLHTRFTDAIEWVEHAGRRVRRLLGGDLGVRLLLRGARAVPLQLPDQLGAREHVPDVRHAVHARRALTPTSEDQHVRVDVVYSQFSRRGKAMADIVSSVFFFIFTIDDVRDRLRGSRWTPSTTGRSRSPNGPSSTGR